MASALVLPAEIGPPQKQGTGVLKVHYRTRREGSQMRPLPSGCAPCYPFGHLVGGHTQPPSEHDAHPLQWQLPHWSAVVGRPKRADRALVPWPASANRVPASAISRKVKRHTFLSNLFIILNTYLSDYVK